MLDMIKISQQELLPFPYSSMLLCCTKITYICQFRPPIHPFSRSQSLNNSLIRISQRRGRENCQKTTEAILFRCLELFEKQTPKIKPSSLFIHAQTLELCFSGVSIQQTVHIVAAPWSVCASTGAILHTHTTPHAR